MKDITYPVQSFYWNLHDEQGNTRIEIRDANKVTVFFMSIKGHEYYEEKRLVDEIVPMIVNLMNDNATERNQTVTHVQDSPISHDNAPKRRGRPPKVLA